jgi:hypothetical protein
VRWAQLRLSAASQLRETRQLALLERYRPQFLLRLVVFQPQVLLATSSIPKILALPALLLKAMQEQLYQRM